ncbi:MAG: hypothetical protein V1806_00835 [Pseudomonadota bacterium]
MTWRWWGLLLGGMVLLAGLYLVSWPLVWRLVLLPRVDPQRQGIEVITNDREDGRGRDIRSLRVPESAFELERPHASQTAQGVWVVSQAGDYDLRLECDDYGSLSIDRRPLIALHGTNPFNQGQARVHLEAGPHLVKLELHNRLGQGWLRLLVRGPGRESPRALSGQDLAAIDLGNYRAWLSLAAWLERGCLFGLGLGLVGCLLLWGLSAREEPGREPATPRRWSRLWAAGFLAAVLAVSAVSAWYTLHNQVEWVNGASGHDYLSHEEWDWHRAVVENRHSDHRAYRVLPDYVLAGVEALLRGHDSDPSPADLIFWTRYFIDLAMFLMAALFYRRLGLGRPAVILGLAVLAWAMYATSLRSGLNFATFLDVSLFLLAGVLVLAGRWRSLVLLSALAALNKETSILIPLLPLAAAWSWRPWRRLPRRELLTTALALGVWLLIYGGMHFILGWGLFAKPHDRPGMDFVYFNFCKDPDSWRQLFKTLGVLPFLALCGLRRAPVALGRFFWTVAPVWFAVHTIIAFWAETRLYMVPMALVFIPLSLFAARGEEPAGHNPASG